MNLKGPSGSPQHLESGELPASVRVGLSIQTPDGEFVACYSEKGLCEMHFPGDQPTTPAPGSPTSPKAVRAWHTLTTQALSCALAGRVPSEVPPLDLSRGTAFQQAVWQAMLQIACGQTRTYAQIAQAVGSPKAVRAVGQACGANPIPVLVPCHRVVAAGQRIGGFSSGLHWKRLLLERESAQPFQLG